ncbi:hypothetical protein [Planococcus antarcticus]|uniref:Transposase n=1 Tax=Planococcus antarcticus DSM 14505 TaxID=1185653 RepID=A0ABM6D492_9BACL|nr:hypothetical protein [Planococcus antarcticus]ANU10204.1 hypothetical protein BBH88_07760 [Planococcus antarcticus DSM 14505]
MKVNEAEWKVFQWLRKVFHRFGMYVKEFGMYIQKNGKKTQVHKEFMAITDFFHHAPYNK